MDYRRRRTDVVRLRLFMCFKGGSSIPRVHGPRYPNSAARQYSAFADQLLACFPENRGIYTQSDSPKKSSRNIWSLAVVSVDQRY